MGTRRNFQDMLNEYLPNSLLREELIKRDYMLTKMARDNRWKGGNLIVPFKGASASSVRFGGLTASSDISRGKYVRGNIPGYREVWGSLIFDQGDIIDHDGRIKEDTFLDLLTDELEDFMSYKKEVVSVQLGSGPYFAKVTVDGNASGELGVDKIDRFQIGQKFTLVDDNTAAANFYVLGINVNTDTITVSSTRGGAPADVSAYTEAQNAAIYHDGVYNSNGNHDTFISMRQAYLSAANGGLAQLHGQTKTDYPILQAYNIDGSSVTASNILEKLFDGMTEGRKRGKGNAKNIIMDLTNYGSCMKQLEISKGQYRVVEAPTESLFGWFETKIANVTGQTLTIAGVQEWDQDLIVGNDFKSHTFRTNGFFRKRMSPDGREYHEIRSEDGYQYIVDCLLFGEAEYRKPGHNWVIHSVDY